MASVSSPPQQPPLGSTAGMTHLFIPGPGGRLQEEGEDKRGEEERLHGQVLLHMPGGMAGASHRGILLKVRQADLSVTSA